MFHLCPIAPPVLSMDCTGNLPWEPSMIVPAINTQQKATFDCERTREIATNDRIKHDWDIMEYQWDIYIISYNRYKHDYLGNPTLNGYLNGNPLPRLITRG